MNCTFQRNANHWTCTRCGWVYPLKTHKAPKKHCRKPLTAAEVLARVRYDLGTGIDDGDWPEVKRRVEVCCGCEKFSGYGCAELGKRCRTGRIRWLERLVMHDCPAWG